MLVENALRERSRVLLGVALIALPIAPPACSAPSDRSSVRAPIRLRILEFVIFSDKYLGN